MKWISVKESLPEHMDVVLVYTKKGQSVVIFLDSKYMNETFCKNGFSSQMIDIKINPYYFSSQETLHHTLNEVTHWMKLPDAPENK